MTELMYINMTLAIDMFVMLSYAGVSASEEWQIFYDECGSELSLDELSAMAAVFHPYSSEYVSICERIGKYLQSRRYSA